MTSPFNCPRHPNERLILSRSQSGIWKAYEEFDNDIYSSPKERPGVFTFVARLNCPTCRCTYSRCPPEFQKTSFEDFDSSTPEQANALALCRQFVAQVN